MDVVQQLSVSLTPVPGKVFVRKDGERRPVFVGMVMSAMIVGISVACAHVGMVLPVSGLTMMSDFAVFVEINI